MWDVAQTLVTQFIPCEDEDLWCLGEDEGGMAVLGTAAMSCKRLKHLVVSASNGEFGAPVGIACIDVRACCPPPHA